MDHERSHRAGSVQPLRLVVRPPEHAGITRDLSTDTRKSQYDTWNTLESHAICQQIPVTHRKSHRKSERAHESQATGGLLVCTYPLATTSAPCNHKQPLRRTPRHHEQRHVQKSVCQVSYCAVFRFSIVFGLECVYSRRWSRSSLPRYPRRHSPASSAAGSPAHRCCSCANRRELLSQKRSPKAWWMMSSLAS